MKVRFTEEFYKEICSKNNISKKYRTYKRTLEEFHKENNKNISFKEYMLEIINYAI